MTRMSNYEDEPTEINAEDTGETGFTEARLAALDPQQLEALCVTAREGIQSVVPFSIEPEPEEYLPSKR